MATFCIKPYKYNFLHKTEKMAQCGIVVAPVRHKEEINHPSTLWYTLVYSSTLWYTLVHPSKLWYTLVDPSILWYTLVHISAP